ncbi:MAG: methionine--tRNA ligase, partial [Alphaproteobacteria bacterium]|nr:methionine--tRNA ligase [Alphaproteobacteria bacterium]
QAAKNADMTPQDFTDKVSENFRALTPLLNLTNDDFIRTTEERHKRGAQAVWNKLKENGDIYLGKYSGWYAVRDEAYYAESELVDGPDGTKIAPTGAPVEWMEESSYFFRLSAYTEKLLEYYEAHPRFIEPEARRNEVIGFVKQGLKDISVSRTTFDWGVPVPDDPAHVMYVWIDALTNYITALGYPDRQAEDFQTFWPADFHVVGKDILRFHAVYWPAFLMSAELSLPKTIFAHGWWTVEGQKMSKSLGNTISPHDMVQDYGLDPSRYFLMREVPFGNDGDFSHDNAVARINADLANGLGNLAQRTLSMIYKNCDAALPLPGAFAPADQALLDAARIRLLPEVRGLFDRFQIHRALEAIWRIVGDANAYIDEQAPWALKKTDPARMETVLYVLAETIRCLALIVQPVMPESAGKILDQLSVPEDRRDFAALTADCGLSPGKAIDQPEGVFPRIVEGDRAQEVA